MNWDVHLISWIKFEIIQNGRKKRRRRKKSYSLNNIHPKKFFWSILWGGKMRFPGYGLRNKPKERAASAMQLLLFIRTAFAIWTANLTEKRAFEDESDWFTGHGHVLNCIDTTYSSSQDLHVSHGWSSQCRHRKPANRKHISFYWEGGRKQSMNNGRWFPGYFIRLLLSAARFTLCTAAIATEHVPARWNLPCEKNWICCNRSGV